MEEDNYRKLLKMIDIIGEKSYSYSGFGLKIEIDESKDEVLKWAGQILKVLNKVEFEKFVKIILEKFDKGGHTIVTNPTIIQVIWFILLYLIKRQKFSKKYKNRESLLKRAI